MCESAQRAGAGDDATDDATGRFFVVTGGPGSGKSTLLDALERVGFARSQEAGRGVIRDQMAVDGHALPWRDPAAFAELMLSWEMRSYHLARHARGPVFFDRGVPDVVGYLRLTGLAVPAHAEAAARRFRYHRRVFIAPPWPEIYAQDTERRQDFAEAVRTYDAMVECYTSYGYRLIELPCVNVKARVRFVMDALDAA
ncbi:ATPase [Burkholderia stabilis]|uniref:ATPase n=1 Tax=Burkholderia stabilis TaxID=95485 RepID=A0A4Q2ATP9_9BURK|nr:AAA family ATPase [Burkholderia stabilis]RXV74002.1 ATPase [Burkholderia stabilis]